MSRGAWLAQWWLRRELAAFMQAHGLSYARIAAVLGITRQRAFQLVQQARA